jgi:hypothetical protein
MPYYQFVLSNKFKCRAATGTSLYQARRVTTPGVHTAGTEGHDTVHSSLTRAEPPEWLKDGKNLTPTDIHTKGCNSWPGGGGPP